MSIAHVIYSIVTQKNMKIKKTFRHIEIKIFTTFFVNRFFRTRYEKKVNSRYNTQKMCTDLGHFVCECYSYCVSIIVFPK